MHNRFEEAHCMLLGHLADVQDDVDAWVLLAKLCLQRRDYPKAIAAAASASRLDPAHSDALYTLGRAHRANGNLNAAEECYRRALASTPSEPSILTSLGILLRARGLTEDAISLYRRALAINPNHAEAANNLGNALAATGAGVEARELHQIGRAALTARLTGMRTSIEALLAAGRPEDARAVLSDALRIAPHDAQTWLAAGKLELALGREQAGLEHIEEAARLAPHAMEANEIARSICVAVGLYDCSMHYSERVLALEPTADVALAKQLLLPAIQQSRHSIGVDRERYAQGLADALASDEPLRGPPAIRGANAFAIASHPAFYLAYHGESNRGLQIDLARVYLKRMPELEMTAPHCRREARPARRIRVGFISRFLCSHSIGNTTRGLIDKLSRELFEVHALRITPGAADDTTQAIRAAADGAMDLAGDLRTARQQIAALELDVLFFQDIGMEPMAYFLAFSRLAPVQCVSFGHPDTTGIPNMDYFVSNDLFEHGDAQAHYSEELFLLRDLPTLAYYYKPKLEEALPREHFGFGAEETLYLCPQALFKLHPDFDALLQGILTRDARAVVVLIDGTIQGWSEALRARFQANFPEVAHRVKFVPRLAYQAFLALIAACDVVLDTVHFNGMNTSLEAFALGKPVVTLPSAMQRGRHTQAMYRKMGVLDGIAGDAESYIATAVRLGTDAGFAQSMRARILARNGALFEDGRVVREFERFFLAALQRRRVRGPTAAEFETRIH